jgi:hypothetical protein
MAIWRLFAWDGALVGVDGGGWFRDSRRWTVRGLRPCFSLRSRVLDRYLRFKRGAAPGAMGNGVGGKLTPCIADVQDAWTVRHDESIPRKG